MIINLKARFLRHFSCLTLRLILLTLMTPSAIIAERIKLQYESFQLLMDCDKRASLMFHYTVHMDTNNYQRSKNYRLDPELNQNCQQKSVYSYRNSIYGPTEFERGHMVPANHMDHSRKAILESNYITNILPQHRTLNRGAWYRTEEIVECYRDIYPLSVFGGPWWDLNVDNRYETSHGLRDIPDAYWKVVYGDKRVIAWWIPNNSSATIKNLDKFLVSVEYVVKRTGLNINIPESLMEYMPSKSWSIPGGCDRS